jgi:hypothetical protein
VSALDVHRTALMSVVRAYAEQSQLAFAWLQGSLAEGLADTADLDVVLAWSESPPEAGHRLPSELADPTPPPKAFTEPNFNLDRFHMSGQQFDVKHATVEEIEGWWASAVAVGGATGYPMPAIALHGLTNGALLHDPGGVGADSVLRFSRPPSTFIEAATRRAIRAVPAYADELSHCVERGDGLLLHDQLVQLVRIVFIAWFARQGIWWPHEKRLSERLRRLGRDDLAALEAELWQGEPADRVRSVMRLVESLAS